MSESGSETPRRRSSTRRLLLQLLVLGAAVVAALPLTRRWRAPEPRPIRLTPVVVESILRMPGVVVRGAAHDWYVNRKTHLAYGEPVPVVVSAYCLSGTTRRGRWVRPGIVAADPRYFPLARYIEVYLGRKYMGRYLVDDTGGKIKGARLDIWMGDCRQARAFGMQRGTAVLVPKETILQAGEPKSSN